MSERPLKRRKANPFIDVEAGVDELEDAGEDDEPEGDIEPDEDEILWDSVHQHSMLLHESSAAKSNSHWDALLDRAFIRARRQSAAVLLEDGSAGGGLWEVGCRPGREAIVANSTKLQDEAFAVVALPSLPGKVFVFADSREVVSLVLERHSDLNGAVVRPVPAEKVHRIATALNENMQPPYWARIRAKASHWKRYRGDTGLVEDAHGVLTLFLLPRPTFRSNDRSKARQAQSDRSKARQAQSLLDLDTLKDQGLIKQVRLCGDGTFMYSKNRYTLSGLLMIPMDTVDAITGQYVVPTLPEFEKFVRAGVVTPTLRLTTRLMIAPETRRVGARIKVSGGPFVAYHGTIVAVTDEDYSVHLPCLNVTVDIEQRFIRCYFRIGDRVKILYGEKAGCFAWVVEVVMGGDPNITIINQDLGLEMEVKGSQLDFAEDEIQEATLRPLATRRGLRVGEADLNRVYIGKRVMVVGSHRLKGYLGLIRDTTPSGTAIVELDATHRMERVPIDSLVAARDKAETSWRQLEAIPMPMLQPEVPGISLTAGGSDVQQRETLPPPPPLDLYTTESGIPWVLDPALRELSLKARIRSHGAASSAVNVLSADGERVCVLDRFSQSTMWLSPDDLSPAHPTAVKQMVTPLVGELKGGVFCVKEYTSKRCIIYKPGRRLRKGERDPEYSTTHLTQINGGRQHSTSRT
ncbi:hypothetical protein CVT26_004428 [Gymnopilus dilepis]|uniref:KOW domain-containing protein n=1 Tax=Gymnopilus dilepis TaxID=231916 RepID=A0A409WDZ2_9AGAR|nr:hypothetical protein CVT26_004428 [Gymnopilus dilepis]